MTEYSSAIATAKRLIEKKGRRDGVLRRPSADEVAPSDKPWAPADPTPGEPEPIVAEGLAVVVLDASLFKKDQLTPETTSVAYLAAGVVPQLGDLLETRGERYSILDVQDLAPGAETVVFILNLKA